MYLRVFTQLYKNKKCKHSVTICLFTYVNNWIFM